MLPPFSPPRYPQDEPLTRTQDAVADTFRGVLRVPLLDGLEVKAQLVAPSPTLLRHGLRTVSGWLVTDIDANARAWRVASAETSGTLALQASAAANVKVWVW